MSSWGDPVADDIAAHLADSVSVNLVGLRGSGRSEIVRLVAERLRARSVSVVMCTGVAALRDHPLAGLAVAGIKIPSGAAASAIAGAVEALTTQLAGSGVLIVDDADDLDAVSAGAIAAAHIQSGFPLFTVMRPGGLQQDTGRTLVNALDPAVRLTLDPMTFAELHRAIHDLLPGPVAPAAVAHIATLSGGLPRLVHAIVDAGRRSGAITEADGVWITTGDLWNPRLAAAVDPLLAGLTDDEMAGLAALSRGGPALAGAGDTVPADVLERLGEYGLVRVTPTAAGPELAVYPPLVREHLRRTEETWAHAAPAEGSRERPGFTNAHAMVLNAQIAEHWQAEVDDARAAWRAHPGAETAVALLRALDATGAGAAEFRAVLDGTDVTGAEPVWRVRFAGWQAAYRALIEGDRDGALALLEPGDGTAQSGLLRAVAALLRPWTGPITEPPARSSGPEDAVRRLTLALRGQTADALAGAPAGDTVPPLFAETAGVAAALARVLHGELDAGVARAATAMAGAESRLDPGELQAYAYVAGVGLAFAGRFDDLAALLDSTLLITNPMVLHVAYQAGLLELSAAVADWRGHREYAGALLAQAGLGGRGAGVFHHLVSHTALAPGAATDDPAAGDRLWVAAETRCADGHIAAGIIHGVAAAEVAPDLTRAAAIARVAERTQSPFLAALGAYVVAAAAGDAPGLAECAARLRELGAHLYAVRAAVTRALALRRQGDLSASVAAADDAWAMAATLGEGFVGLFVRLGHAAGLNDREREITTLLAGGATPQSIATTLSLSLRTVENYLSSAYRKLGTEGRADAAQAVSTWARLD